MDTSDSYKYSLKKIWIQLKFVGFLMEQRQSWEARPVKPHWKWSLEHPRNPYPSPNPKQSYAYLIHKLKELSQK